MWADFGLASWVIEPVLSSLSNKLWGWPPVIGVDKYLHFIVSFLIGQVSPALAYVAGWGKEFFDLATGGIIDIGDLIADGFGVLAAILVFP